MTYTLHAGVSKEKIGRLSLFFIALASAITLTFAMFTSVFAQPTGSTSLFGDASEESDGVHLVSNGTELFSGIEFELEPGTTVDDLAHLEADLTKVVGNCLVGSLRFSVTTSAGNIFVYLGDHPDFDNCEDGTTGNLLSDVDTRVDTTQVGGAFYDTWANAKTLVGTEEITGLFLVADGGWSLDQEFVIHNAMVNSTPYSFMPLASPADKNECKNGGFTDFGFSNQGRCIQYANTGRDSR